MSYKPSAVRRDLTTKITVPGYVTSYGNVARGNVPLDRTKVDPVPNIESATNKELDPTGALPLPPCPKCGHVELSTKQSSWSGRAFASLAGFLTPEECRKIESMAGDLRRGTIGHDNSETLDNEIRRSDISWIEGSEANAWLFERLWAAIGTANENLFKYDIQWLEPLQFSVYRADDQGGYAPHYDWGNDARGIRKLSFSIQLTDDKAYTGGDLVIWAGHPEPVVADRTIGSITVFPSWMLHTVTPMEQGVRKSLVGWFEGPVHF